MFGIETIAVLDIDGILAHIMGHYDEHCDDGEYVGFDIYVKNERSNIFSICFKAYGKKGNYFNNDFTMLLAASRPS